MPSTPAALTYSVRSIQAILAASTIGLTAALIADQSPSPNGALIYGLVVGVITIFGALIGAAALWFPILQGLILLLVDVLAMCINLAGGLVFAIKLEGVDCLDQSASHMRDELIHISLLNGDCPTPDLDYKCMGWDEGDGFLQRRCRWATAAAVVMFVNFLVVLVGILVEYLAGKGRVRK